MSADFLDSNVFLYLFDETDARTREIAQRLIREALEGGRASISFQVVQETLNVLTRKLATPLSPDEARQFLDRVLLPLWRISPSAALYHRALDVQARYRYGFYDSLIVAASLESGCTRLFSEDLPDGQRIEAVVIENPFRAGDRPRDAP